MNAKDFRAEAKTGLSGAYLFYGSEEYTKRHSLELARKSVLGPSADDFNHEKLSGEGKSLSDLSSLLEDRFATPSFFGSKLIELHECMLLKPNENELTRFAAVLESIKGDRDNVLILYTNEQELDVGSAKAPSKVFRTLSSCMKTVEFQKESGQRLADWVNKHFAAGGIAARIELCADLIAYVGHDMSMLADEIDKLCYYLHAHGRRELTGEAIALVSCSNTEIDTFDFSNAILAGDRERAFVILNDMKGKKEEPTLVLGGIGKIFTDLCAVKALADRGLQKTQIAKTLGQHEYAVSLKLKAAAAKPYEALSRAVALCAETDLKMKRASTDKYLLLELLVLRLLTGK